MKKAILFLLALVLLSVITNADVPGTNPLLKRSTAKNGTCFDENTHIINIGVGLGGNFYYKYGKNYEYRSTPAFSCTYEQAYPKKLGPGYLGVGAYGGFRTAHSRNSDYYYQGSRYYYEHRWTDMMLAARGVYHWDVLNAKNAEVYGGALVGFRITTYKYSTNSNDPDAGYYKRSDGGFYPIGSLFAGARWYFVPNVALYGEAGFGISYLTGGVSFKW